MEKLYVKRMTLPAEDAKKAKYLMETTFLSMEELIKMLIRQEYDARTRHKNSLTLDALKNYK